MPSMRRRRRRGEPRWLARRLGPRGTWAWVAESCSCGTGSVTTPRSPSDSTDSTSSPRPCPPGHRDDTARSALPAVRSPAPPRSSVDPARHDLTLRLYLLEIAARYVEALTHGATPALHAAPPGPSRCSSAPRSSRIPHPREDDHEHCAPPLPTPSRPPGGSASVRVGSVTAGRRQLPSFIMVGAQRAGTTSLFRALMSHPIIHSANDHKGVNYFDVASTGTGPGTCRTSRRSRPAQAPPGHGRRPSSRPAATTCSTRTPRRGSPRLPNVKIVAMVRDPVERAYSAYKHEFARGFETETFEKALELEDQRMAGQAGGCSPTRSTRATRIGTRPTRRGHYAEQLKRSAILPASRCM